MDSLSLFIGGIKRKTVSTQRSIISVKINYVENTENN